MSYPNREPVAIDGFLIDATVSEGHEHASEVTKFPVEKGIDVTDNIRPEHGALECIVSDSPIGRVFDRRLAAKQIDATGAVTGTNALSKQAYAKMIALRDAREPFLIQTSLRDFPSMALSNLSVPRRSGEPDALHFTATFTQIEIVENARRSVQTAQGRTSMGHRSPGTKFVQTTVWRQGAPPGSFNIVNNRYVLFSQKPSGEWAYFFSETNVRAASIIGTITPDRELTASEQAAFNKDFDRDYNVQDTTGGMYATWAGRKTNEALLPPQSPTQSGADKFIPYRRFK